MPAVGVYSGTERGTRRLRVIATRELSVAHASHEPRHTQFKFSERKEQLSFKLHILNSTQKLKTLEDGSGCTICQY